MSCTPLPKAAQPVRANQRIALPRGIRQISVCEFPILILNASLHQPISQRRVIAHNMRSRLEDVPLYGEPYNCMISYELNVVSSAFFANLVIGHHRVCRTKTQDYFINLSNKSLLPRSMGRRLCSHDLKANYNKTI